VEATEQERENIPKRNYFPTSKDKRFLAEQELLKKSTEQLSALLDSTPTSPADFPDLFPSTLPGPEDEQLGAGSLESVRSKWNMNPFGKGRKKQTKEAEWSSTDSDGSEEVDLQQQRRRFKAANQKYTSALTATALNPALATAAQGFSTKGPGSTTVTQVTPLHSDIRTTSAGNTPTANGAVLSVGTSSSCGSNVSRISTGSLLAGRTHKGNTTAQPSSPSPAVDSKSATAALPPPSSAQSMSAASPYFANSTAPVCVTIEDYTLTPSSVEMCVGQALQFQLAASVPAHAEHELFAISTTKGLTFEAPLLQKGESTSYSFTPVCAGEMVISCRVYAEMQCTVTVHPARAAVSVSGSLLGQPRNQGTKTPVSGGGMSPKPSSFPTAKGVGPAASVQRTDSSEEVVLRDEASGADKVDATGPLPEAKRIAETVSAMTKATARGNGVSTQPSRANDAHIASPAVTPIVHVPSTHTTPSGTVVFTPAGKRSPMSTAATAGSQYNTTNANDSAPSSPISPSTAALQGTGSRVLTIDPHVIARPKQHASGSFRDDADSDSSKNSFYDSDDFYSDLETPKSNLGRLFNEAEAQRVPAQTSSIGKSSAADADWAAAIKEEEDLRSEVLFAPTLPVKDPQQQHMDTTSLYPHNATRAPFVPSAYMNGAQRDVAMGANAPVAHTVDLEEYGFKPRELVIKAGERVRFLRSANLLEVKVFCDGEFPPTALSTPYAPEHSAEPHVCYEHTFQTVGKFDVQNEIFCFLHCAVVVVPSTNPSSSACGGVGELRQRKGYKLGSSITGVTPALLGSFTGAVPAQPVFHQPVVSAGPAVPATAALRGSPHKLPPLAATAPAGALTRPSTQVPTITPTTTTTVNASTTTVTTTSMASIDVAPVNSNARTHSPTTSLGVTGATSTAPSTNVGHKPTKTPAIRSPTSLYGSFPPALHANDVPPSQRIEPSIDDYIRSYLAADARPLPAIPNSAASIPSTSASTADQSASANTAGGSSPAKKTATVGTMDVIDESGESAEEAEEAASAAARDAKKKARNRKKRERAKEKAREQRQQIESSLLGLIEECAVETGFVAPAAQTGAAGGYSDEEADADERAPLLPKGQHAQSEDSGSPGALGGVCTYRSDATVSRAYLTATTAADLHVDLDSDNEDTAMEVCTEPAVPVRQEQSPESAQTRAVAEAQITHAQYNSAAVQASPISQSAESADRKAAESTTERMYVSTAMQTPPTAENDPCTEAVPNADAATVAAGTETVADAPAGAAAGRKKRKKRGKGGSGASAEPVSDAAVLDTSTGSPTVALVDAPVAVSEPPAREAHVPTPVELTAVHDVSEPAGTAVEEQTHEAGTTAAVSAQPTNPATAEPSDAHLVTPQKVRPGRQKSASPPPLPAVPSTPPPTRSKVAAETASTPANRSNGVQGPPESASKRNSSLLRDVLKISAHKGPAVSFFETTPPAAAATEAAEGSAVAAETSYDMDVPRTPSPSLSVEDDDVEDGEGHSIGGTEEEDGRLSMLVAYEQQMEEFFMSRKYCCTCRHGVFLLPVCFLSGLCGLHRCASRPHPRAAQRPGEFRRARVCFELPLTVLACCPVYIGYEVLERLHNDGKKGNYIVCACTCERVVFLHEVLLCCADRLPSGREVEILYLEDLMLVDAAPPTKTKSRFHSPTAANGHSGRGPSHGGGGGQNGAGKGNKGTGSAGGNNSGRAEGNKANKGSAGVKGDKAKKPPQRSGRKAK
jgi:plastocyanin